MSKHPGIIGHHQETPRDSSNHSLGHQCSLSGSIGLWLSYHMSSTGHPHMSNHPREIGHHQETPRNSSNHALGHQCSFSGPIGLWLKYPYFNHRSPTYVRTPRNNQASPGKSRKNPGILQTIHWVTNVHSVGFSGSIGLWLSYHKLPIWECLQNGVPQTFFFHLKKKFGALMWAPLF